MPQRSKAPGIEAPAATFVHSDYAALGIAESLCNSYLGGIGGYLLPTAEVTQRSSSRAAVS
jgi:hypothetical protein